MATYAIGDIQGCYSELRLLLDKLKFESKTDRLWLVGDLVNRGPKSLQTLRFVKGLGQSATTVLGNHDLTLLAKSAGVKRVKDGDTLSSILKATDRDELLDWLRRRPLMHHDAQIGYTMVHAGLLPQWDLKLATACASEVERVLRGSGYVDFLEHMYGDQPNRWSSELSGWGRRRLITNTFTRLRYCDPKGRMAMEPNGAPGTQPKGLLPWFKVKGRRSANLRIVFGHWSTLGYLREKGLAALDTGCVWGGSLTALRLDKSGAKPCRIKCKGSRRPG